MNKIFTLLFSCIIAALPAMAQKTIDKEELTIVDTSPGAHYFGRDTISVGDRTFKVSFGNFSGKYMLLEDLSNVYFSKQLAYNRATGETFVGLMAPYVELGDSLASGILKEILPEEQYQACRNARGDLFCYPVIDPSIGKIIEMGYEFVYYDSGQILSITPEQLVEFEKRFVERFTFDRMEEFKDWTYIQSKCLILCHD